MDEIHHKLIDMKENIFSAKAEAQYANAPAAMTANRSKTEEMVNSLFSKNAHTANGDFISYFTNSKGANMSLEGITFIADEWEGEVSWEVSFFVDVYNNDFTKKVSTLIWFDSEVLNCTSLMRYLAEEHGDDNWEEDDFCVPESHMNNVLMSINLNKLFAELEDYDCLDDYEDWTKYDCNLCGCYDLIKKERVA